MSNDVIRQERDHWSIAPSTVVIIRPGGTLKSESSGGTIRNADIIRMNVPTWLMRLLLFVANQQWQMKRR